MKKKKGYSVIIRIYYFLMQMFFILWIIFWLTAWVSKIGTQGLVQLGKKGKVFTRIENVILPVNNWFNLKIWRFF